MSGDSIAQAIYLALLGTALLGWMVVQNRKNLSKTMQQALVWGLIFVGVIAGVGLWGDIRRETLNLPRPSKDGGIEIQRGPGGHFYLPAQVNGAPITFIADTGATGVVLSVEDARKVGIDTETLLFTGSAQTANGITRTARVRLKEVVIAPLSRKDQRAYVNQGELGQSLLGMDFLSQFHITMTPDVMRISP